jgi:nucleotide-binding universal stress UspA family protein
VMETTSGTIVVAIDNTPGARQAVRWAVLHAVETGAVVRIVHAFDLPDTPAARLEHNLGDALEEVRSRAHAWAADALAGLDVGVSVAVEAQAGDVATIVSRAARNAGTLVVGDSADRGHPVLDHVVLKPRCEIVVVDEEGRAHALREIVANADRTTTL